MKMDRNWITLGLFTALIVLTVGCGGNPAPVRAPDDRVDHAPVLAKGQLILIAKRKQVIPFPAAQIVPARLGPLSIE